MNTIVSYFKEEFSKAKHYLIEQYGIMFIFALVMIYNVVSAFVAPFFQ